MDAAKASVKKFIGKDGKHDTTVHESVNPAVKHENVTRTEHEHVTPVVDREVHQDHHHTTVQPIQDREVRPETHHHREAGVEHRSFEHDNEQEVQRRLAEERAQFGDKQTHMEGERTATNEAVVTGEHKHHHVHETIQPVVQKETIEPHVVHTTVPVHEVHHNASQHHTGSTLPAMTMSEFQQQGGSLEGREERVDKFAGEPRLNADQVGHTTGQAHGSSHESYDSQGKPSLMDKINPKKDADMDGKKGFMS